MFNTRTEKLATEASPGLLWRVLDCDGSALPGRASRRTAASTSDRGPEHAERYCLCPMGVATAVSAGHGGGPYDATEERA